MRDTPTSTDEALNSPPVRDADDESRTWWLAPLAALFAGVALVASGLYVYHTKFAHKPVKFAVFDLNKVVDSKELIFTAMLSKPGVTDEDRKVALDLVAKIEPELQAVLAEIRQECGCEILVKAAAMSSPNIPDLTMVVAQRMKITEADLSQAKETIMKSMQVTNEVAKPLGK